MRIKRNISKYHWNQMSLFPLCVLDDCSDAAQPRHISATSWPQQEHRNVSLSVSLRSHVLHLLTPGFYSHHLLSVFISFLIFASVVFPFPSHSLPLWLPLTSSHLPLSSTLFLTLFKVQNSLWNTERPFYRLYFEKKNESHTHWRSEQSTAETSNQDIAKIVKRGSTLSEFWDGSSFDRFR